MYDIKSDGQLLQLLLHIVSESPIIEMVVRLPSHILHFRPLKLYLTNITSPLPAKILIETFEYYYSYYKHFIIVGVFNLKETNPLHQITDPPPSARPHLTFQPIKTLSYTTE
jgi:hypothetical protein